MSSKKINKALKKYQHILETLMNGDYKDSSKHTHKYCCVIGDDDSIPDIEKTSGYDLLNYDSEPSAKPDNVPEWLFLKPFFDSGFFVGYIRCYGLHHYIGISAKTEGHILIIGGTGSGKSSGTIKPTLLTWKDAICATDIKGELSDFYSNLYQQGIVTRPYKIFDPMQADGIAYDPLYCVRRDDTANLVNNIREIVLAIIPTPLADKDPFWIQSEQSILTAALLFYLDLGLNFSTIMISVIDLTITELCTEIQSSQNILAKKFIGELSSLKPEQLAAIGTGLRNKLLVFATDPYISNAFGNVQNKVNCFTWDDLDEYNIFLRIPADKIEQWGSIINLMYEQLIHHLERKPDNFSSNGKNNIPTLLLMDEFARFGKLEVITNAVATLRSKNIHLCLIVQSLAQLDKIYGEYDRRNILENCHFKLILSANDPDTQEYISRLIGTHPVTQQSHSYSYDADSDYIGHTEQVNETREFIIFPHELSTLTDILFLTPDGFFHVDKLQLYNIASVYSLFPVPEILYADSYIALPSSKQTDMPAVIDAQHNVVPTNDTLTGDNTKDQSGISIKIVSCRKIDNRPTEHFEYT